jgi:hypothetical protein
MKRTRFNRLVRGCFALTLTLSDWMELEAMLERSRRARTLFWRRVRCRSRRSALPAPNLVAGLAGASRLLSVCRCE